LLGGCATTPVGLSLFHEVGNHIHHLQSHQSSTKTNLGFRVNGERALTPSHKALRAHASHKHPVPGTTSSSLHVFPARFNHITSRNFNTVIAPAVIHGLWRSDGVRPCGTASCGMRHTKELWRSIEHSAASCTACWGSKPTH
jgi:hypothetical protein